MTGLVVNELTKEYRVRKKHGRVLKAVDSASFTLDAGRTVALVGESGSGKSTIAKILLQLEKPTSGEIVLGGQPISRGGKGLTDYRREVQMVFQDPFASLNPFHTVRHHIERPIARSGLGLNRHQIAERVERWLSRVGLEPAREFAERHPHELSGGQRQRVAIARALAPEPSILIADEPVSMLDVSIRLDILNLLADLQNEENLGVLYITHDLATARHFSDEILVMYKGKIVEHGMADDVILRPKHPYTQRLIDAAPNPDRRFTTLA